MIDVNIVLKFIHNYLCQLIINIFMHFIKNRVFLIKIIFYNLAVYNAVYHTIEQN